MLSSVLMAEFSTNAGLAGYGAEGVGKDRQVTTGGLRDNYPFEFTRSPLYTCGLMTVCNSRREEPGVVKRRRQQVIARIAI